MCKDKDVHVHVVTLPFFLSYFFKLVCYAHVFPCKHYSGMYIP